MQKPFDKNTPYQNISREHALKRRKEARVLYVKKGWPHEEIARHIGVQKSTVKRWQTLDKQDGSDWNKSKIALSVMDRDQHMAEVLDDYLQVHRQVMTDIKSNLDIDAITKTRMLASLADTFIKTTKAASRVSPEINHIAASHEMLSKLTEYIIKNHSDCAVDFAEILENFGNQFANST